MPIAGGVGARAVARIDYRPLAEVFALLAQARGCDAPTVRTDEFGARESTYVCARGATIVVKILPGVGHTWPGAEPRPLQRNRYTGDFSAGEAAWAFARQFSR